MILLSIYKKTKQTYSVAWVHKWTTPEWPTFVGEDSANFGEGGCHMVSTADPLQPYSWISRPELLFFFQVAPQLYLGWVDPVPDQLLLRKSGSAGNQTRTSGSVARNSDH
jgi:hypothetical protein